jgi:hypothetical protein
VRPTLHGELGLGLKGLEAEGLLVALFIFLGINVAWTHFMNPSRRTDRPRTDRGDRPAGGF